MSLYPLTPKPGYERYTIQIGWNPGRSFYANIFDDTSDTDPESTPDHPEPISVHLGMGDPILNASVVIDAVREYAVIPTTLASDLNTDQARRPRPPWAIL